MTAEPITAIADNIITAAGADSLPADARAVFRQNIEAQLLRRLGLIIMEHLDDTGAAAYEKLVADNPAPSASDMQSFLEQYLPDYEEKIKAGMDEFMRDIAGFIARSQAAV